jgi:hypothetical protein
MDTPAKIALAANIFSDVALAPGERQWRKGRDRRPRVPTVHNENNLGWRIVCITWLDRWPPSQPLEDRLTAALATAPSESYDEMILWRRSQTDHGAAGRGGGRESRNWTREPT